MCSHAFTQFLPWGFALFSLKILAWPIVHWTRVNKNFVNCLTKSDKGDKTSLQNKTVGDAFSSSIFIFSSWPFPKCAREAKKGLPDPLPNNHPSLQPPYSFWSTTMVVKLLTFFFVCCPGEIVSVLFNFRKSLLMRLSGSYCWLDLLSCFWASFLDW